MAPSATTIFRHLKDVNPSRSWILSNLDLDRQFLDFSVDDTGKIVLKDCDESFQSFIWNELLYGTGFRILRLSNANAYSDSELEKISRSVAQSIGFLHPQNKQGDLDYRVENVEGQSTNLFRFSKSNLDSSFHTDCAYRDVVPKIATLFCIHPAHDGGISQVSSVYSSLRTLAEKDPEIMEVFLGEYYYHRRGTEQPGESPVGYFPMIQMAEDHLFIRYLRSYIEIGQDSVGQSLTAAQKMAFDALDELASSDARVLNYKLERGECLAANNMWLFHNRTEFHDAVDGPKRLVMRHWIG